MRQQQASSAKNILNYSPGAKAWDKRKHLFQPHPWMSLIDGCRLGHPLWPLGQAEGRHSSTHSSSTQEAASCIQGG